MGASFAHYVVTPLAMNFFIGFADAIPILTSYILGTEPPAVSESTTELQTVFLGSIRESLDLALKFIFAFGFCFQLPVLLTLLGKAGLVSAEGLGNVRKWAVVGILTLAALITPPDVITQLILFTVVYGLYEISIQLVRLVERTQPPPARGRHPRRRRGILTPMSDDALSRIAEALERLRPPPAKAPDWAAAEAFVWHADPDRLEPVARVNRVDLPLLLGIDRSRDTLLQNTRQFARACRPTTRCSGARGGWGNPRW
jgi:hypothetical protein